MAVMNSPDVSAPASPDGDHQTGRRGAAEPGRGGPHGRDPSLRGRTLAVLVPLVLVAVAGTLRFYRVGHPERCYFDETYYYYDARDILEFGVERDFVVHPPAGKWPIAAGLALFGVEPGAPLDQAVTEEPEGCPLRDRFVNAPARAREAAEAVARRLPSVVFGTLWVGLTYLAGLRLFRRRGLAALAALLVCVDGLAFTMSRIAMLDVFLGFWVTLGFWLLLVDRDRQWTGVPAADEPRRRRRVRRGPRWLRWLAAVAFGLALASKVSGILAVGAAGLFMVVNEFAWHRRLTGRSWPGSGRILATAAVALLPFVVYVGSYVPWFAAYDLTVPGSVPCSAADCPTTVTGEARRRAEGWLSEQARLYLFHRDLEAKHLYRAPASSWPLLLRPVAYYFEDCSPDDVAHHRRCTVPPGHVEEILGLPNPAVWWLGLAACAWLVWAAIRRRDWVAWALLAFILLQYLPWLLSPRTVFLFYATPIVPFICLALAYAAGEAATHRRLAWVPAAVAALAVAAFVYWYPVYSGSDLTVEAWRAHLWVPSWA